MRPLPPVLLLVALVLMAGLRLCLPGPVIVQAPWNWLGAAPILSGLAIAVSASRQFARRGTNIRTFDDPDHLVVEGLFRWTRNPMYLGFVLVLLGAALLLQTASPFGPALAFAVITDRWYIRFEEAAMRRRFGAAYEAYAGRVRRWI